MLKRRGMALMVLSLALALGAAWVARGWVMSRFQDPRHAVPQMSVVTAAMEIPFGSKVDPHYLRVIELPASTPIGAHFSNPKQVVGMVSVEKVLPGAILQPGQFTRHPTGSLLAALLPPGMRAISVHVDDVTDVAGFLLPGNHVDVVEARMKGPHAVTRTILQDILVLAVDQTDTHNKNSPQLVRAVTLEVTPPQADELVKAMTEGHIQLTLRGPNAVNVPEPAVVRTVPRKRHVWHRIARPVHFIVHRENSSTVTIIRGTNIQHTRPTTHAAG